MSSCIKKHIDEIKVLRKAKPKLRKAILSEADKDLVLALCEIVINVLNGNVKLSDSERSKLIRYKKALRDLANKKNSVKAKRDILVQRGGFLAALLPPALGLLASIIGKAI